MYYSHTLNSSPSLQTELPSFLAHFVLLRLLLGLSCLIDQPIASFQNNHVSASVSVSDCLLSCHLLLMAMDYVLCFSFSYNEHPQVKQKVIEMN